MENIIVAYLDGVREKVEKLKKIPRITTERFGRT